MSYVPPTFNLDISAWHDPGGVQTIPPFGPPSYTVKGQLWMPRTAFALASTLIAGAPMFVSLPSLTPAVGSYGWNATLGGLGDILEIPSGTGRFYRIYTVDDMHKGFPNEYRLACLQQLLAPDPLP